LLNERLLVIRQVFKVDLEDCLIIHVDDCGPTECAKNVSTTESNRVPPAHEASREKPRGADLELSPGLGRALDQIVVTKDVPVNLTL
jgi:hypothetical protein